MNIRYSQLSKEHNKKRARSVGHIVYPLLLLLVVFISSFIYYGNITLEESTREIIERREKAYQEEEGDSQISVNKRKDFEIIQEYKREPHFTQGYFFLNDLLVESSGGFGNSKLIKTRINESTSNIEIIKQQELPKEFKDKFGEGCEYFETKKYGNVIVQLLWKAGTILLYDASTFEFKTSIK